MFRVAGVISYSLASLTSRSRAVTGAPQFVFRGSRQFHLTSASRRSIKVVGCRLRVGAALLRLPAIPFCILFSCLIMRGQPIRSRRRGLFWYLGSN
jgi:hypothetical protein